MQGRKIMTLDNCPAHPESGKIILFLISLFESQSNVLILQ